MTFGGEEIDCARLRQLEHAEPNSPVDLWTVQSPDAIKDLYKNEVLVGKPCGMPKQLDNYKHRAYCWMRDEMRRRIPPVRQYPNWQWPIWACATRTSIDRQGDQILHIRLPRDSMLFSWHCLWERLLQIMESPNGIDPYFAFDEQDRHRVCPNNRMPLPSDTVCQNSWPRMFCLNMLQSSLYKNKTDKVLQATITHIPIEAVVDRC